MRPLLCFFGYMALILGFAWLIGGEGHKCAKDIEQHGLKTKIERLWYGAAPDGGAR